MFAIFVALIYLSLSISPNAAFLCCANCDIVCDVLRNELAECDLSTDCTNTYILRRYCKRHREIEREERSAWVRALSQEQAEERSLGQAKEIEEQTKPSERAGKYYRYYSTVQYGPVQL